MIRIITINLVVSVKNFIALNVFQSCIVTLVFTKVSIVKNVIVQFTIYITKFLLHNLFKSKNIL